MVFKMMLIIYMILSQLNLETLFGTSLNIGGYPVLTFVVYLLYIVAAFYSLMLCLNRGKNNSYQNLTVFFILATIATYLLSYHKNGLDTLMLIRYSYSYVLPITLFGYLSYTTLTKKEVYNSVCSVVIMLGIISILFMSGILEKIATENITSLERSSTIIDGGMGLVGIVLSLYLIFFDEGKTVSTKTVIITFVMGVIIVIAGRSRARMLAMVFIIAVMVFCSLQYKKVRFDTLLAIIIVSIIGAAFIYLVNPEPFNAFFEEIFGRFETMGTDNSSLYRITERNAQFEEFRKNTLIGTGWGGMRFEILKNEWGNLTLISDHNMYTTVLAYGGLLFSVPFFLWFVNIIVKELNRVAKHPSSLLNLCLIVILAILSYSSAGFVKHSQIISMLIVYINIIERDNIKIKRKKVALTVDTKGDTMFKEMVFRFRNK